MNTNGLTAGNEVIDRLGSSACSDVVNLMVGKVRSEDQYQEKLAQDGLVFACSEQTQYQPDPKGQPHEVVARAPPFRRSEDLSEHKEYTRKTGPIMEYFESASCPSSRSAERASNRTLPSPTTQCSDTNRMTSPTAINRNSRGLLYPGSSFV